MHAMIKAGHNGGILAGIMHTGIANMLMWQRIKEERGVRVTRVHACIGKHIFLWRTTALVEYFCRLQKLFHNVSTFTMSKQYFYTHYKM